MLTLSVEVLPGGIMPSKAHSSDSCWDCHIAHDLLIPKQSTAVASLGFRLELPPFLEAQVRGRSGLAKRGILCHTGTIDSGYRGEVSAILVNTRPKSVKFEKGQRVAQLAIAHKYPTILKSVNRIPLDTDRGTDGFGSTGA